jgi:hypothetical protein
MVTGGMRLYRLRFPLSRGSGLASMIFHKKACADEIIRLRMALDAAQTEYTPIEKLRPVHFVMIQELQKLENQYKHVARLEQLCFAAIVVAAQERRKVEDEIMRKAWREQS